MSARYGRPEIERFMRHVRIEPSGCWLWTGSLWGGGYGQFKNARSRYAHRFAYEHFVAPVPRGKDLDHLCRVRRCVNPEHLEVVTRRENLLRGDHPTARAIRTGVCKYGHRAYARRPSGRAFCRTCDLIRKRMASQGSTADVP